MSNDSIKTILGYFLALTGLFIIVSEVTLLLINKPQHSLGHYPLGIWIYGIGGAAVLSWLWFKTDSKVVITRASDKESV